MAMQVLFVLSWMGRELVMGKMERAVLFSQVLFAQGWMAKESAVGELERAGLFFQGQFLQGMNDIFEGGAECALASIYGEVHR